MRRRRNAVPRTVRGKAAAVRVGPPHGRRGGHSSVISPRYRIISSVCVFLICLLTGLLGATNLRFNGTQGSPRDVESLISQRQQRVKSLRGDISRLSSDIDSINKTVGNTDKNGDHTDDKDETAGTASQMPALTGPGLSVTLDDSPLWEAAARGSDKELSDRDVNDYVVHQQDLEAVINALWAGGAEAMTIQGERVLPNTAVRCVGNVLLLRGRQYAPPYTVSAIGPVARMRRALASSAAVRTYKEYVEAVGLGWKVQESDRLHFAATTGVTSSLDYASVVPGKATGEKSGGAPDGRSSDDGWRTVPMTKQSRRSVGLGDMSMTTGAGADPRGGKDAVTADEGVGRDGGRRHRSIGWDIAGVLGEILLGLGIICVLYVVWQLWWTGVDSARTQAAQEKTMSWTTPASSDGSFKIAKAQAGDPPVDAQPVEGSVIGQIYIPRFGASWKRLVVQGTTLAQLARHGMGHYDDTAMPGGVGNFSVAGHRAGYGEPLGNIDKLKNGDALIIRTQNHWYVYTMTSHEIVLPTQTEVVAPVPGHPGATPTQRIITLTTCEPRYTTPTHRWIVHGKLKYWANVSDGIPKELARTNSTGAITFTQAGQSTQSKIPPLTTMLLWTTIAFLVLFIAAAVAWGWPGLRRFDAQGRPVHHAVSLYGSIVRLMPGATCVRVVEFLLLLAMAVMALFQWTFPWAAGNIPVLQVASNYVTV